jgi:hypothetical protein
MFSGIFTLIYLLLSEKFDKNGGRSLEKNLNVARVGNSFKFNA